MPTTEPGRKPARNTGLWDGPGIRRLLAVMFAAALVFAAPAPAYNDWGWGGWCGPDTVGVQMYEPWVGGGWLIRTCIQRDDGSYDDPPTGYTR